MLYTEIIPNHYSDSIALMLLSAKVEAAPGIARATVMMGTPGNKEIMRGSGFGTPELDKAGAGDLVVVFEAGDEAAREAVLGLLAAGDESAAGGEAEGGLATVSSWRQAAEKAAGCSLALISVPGEYAADEAMAALNSGRHVLMFSDNVGLEDEAALKKLAHEKGLLMMGPDCGTAIIGGVPLAFANRVRGGGIGLVGASGTGLQEVSVAIHRLGGGVSQAIGTGGRDLSAGVGAVTMLDALCALNEDAATEVVVAISKPPEPAVANKVLGLLAGLSKPAVVLLLGQPPRAAAGNVHFAYTMEEAARLAVSLAGLSAAPAALPQPQAMAGERPRLVGLFSGGTLAYEAAMLARAAMGPNQKEEGHGGGVILRTADAEILDLGDDVYTRGRPHPMIDPTARLRQLETLADEKRPLVVLLDVVLGTGAMEDPAADLAPALRALRERRSAAGGFATEFVINLLGTEGDPQGFARQQAALEAAGARVFAGNLPAVGCALALCGWQMAEPEKQPAPRLAAAKPPRAAEGIMQLLAGKPAVLNLGLKSFAQELAAGGAQVVHFDWRPIAGGDRRLRRALAYLEDYRFPGGPYKTIDEANRAVAERVVAAQPTLADVVPAHTMAPVLNGKVLLHAGPPIEWAAMTEPMQGACVGAALFEGWVETEEEGWALLNGGGVAFEPCHHHGFVGPMGGITSAHMPVLLMENRAGGEEAGNTACCTMNEGIGPVLRFGAYGPEVVARLRFMRDELAPTLSAALKAAGGLDVSAMVARAVAMGDEFHQRNIAASMVFLKELAPAISALDIDAGVRTRVLKFLADTEQFFLNIMMAAAKCTMDYAAGLRAGTVVTVMTRNGRDFGIRLSGTGQTWYTGPVNTPRGLYFSGYSAADGNPDIGDSAITEAFGVGGMAMIAAPAVTRFVGSGGFYDALATSNQMAKLCVGHNSRFPVPTWDFKGICLGIDARRVVESGVTPVINTGIAHKKAGVGQVGAGTVRPPLACFEKAVLAYAEQLGFEG